MDDVEEFGLHAEEVHVGLPWMVRKFPYYHSMSLYSLIIYASERYDCEINILTA